MPHKPSSTIEDYLMEIYDWSREGRPVIAARLTEKMGVTAPTVWNTVHRMQRDGLVEIDAGEGDHALRTPAWRPPNRSSGATS